MKYALQNRIQVAGALSLGADQTEKYLRRSPDAKVKKLPFQR
jgi:hypothetical protein